MSSDGTSKTSVTRRQLLGATGAAVGAGIAGCIGGQSGTTKEGNGNGGTGNTVTFLNDRSARNVWESAAEEFNSGSKCSFNSQFGGLP